VSTKKLETAMQPQSSSSGAPQQQVKMLRKDMPGQQSSSSTIVSGSHDSLSAAAAAGMVSSEVCSTSTCPTTTTSTTGYIDAPPTKPKSRRPSFLPTKGIASATKLINQHFFGNLLSFQMHIIYYLHIMIAFSRVHVYTLYNTLHYVTSP